jgi:hypothetical protein
MLLMLWLRESVAFDAASERYSRAYERVTRIPEIARNYSEEEEQVAWAEAFAARDAAMVALAKTPATTFDALIRKVRVIGGLHEAGKLDREALVSLEHDVDQLRRWAKKLW